MGTGYTTLDDLESRLDRAVDDGILSEQEAAEELMYAMEEERRIQEQAELEAMWMESGQSLDEECGFSF